MVTTDALIIGGGPAGLAAAIALRLKGMRALVVDCTCPPVDKACGEGLMPNGVDSLRALGVDLDIEGAGRFSGIRFLSGPDTVDAHFPQRIRRGREAHRPPRAITGVCRALRRRCEMGRETRCDGGRRISNRW